ncbi:hypothetical protein H9P43_005477 [Blastocladiella emersonii ATCC 22665]|nr:hypothetical protein H9P43_005477 [Blastocladiella emersonii ATCC 22665]
MEHPTDTKYTSFPAPPQTPVPASASAAAAPAALPLPVPAPPAPPRRTDHVADFADDDDPYDDDDLLAGPWSLATSRPTRRPFFSLQPRPVPTLIFFVAAILYTYLAGGRAHLPDSGSIPRPALVSPVFQALLSAAAPAVIGGLKQVWIPNPKDDLVAGPAGWAGHAKRYGLVSAALYGAGLADLVALRAAGPIPVVAVSAVLPVLVLGLVRRVSSRAVAGAAGGLTPRLAAGLAASMAGMVLLALALDEETTRDTAAVSFGTLLAALAGVACRAFVLVWAEKYFVENESDPWVLVHHLVPVSLACGVGVWLVFDRTLPWGMTGWFMPALRTATLSGTGVLASAFLVHHVSSFALAVLEQIVHAVLLVMYWQLENVSIMWYGIVGVAAFAGGLKFVAPASAGSSRPGSRTAYAQAPAAESTESL